MLRNRFGVDGKSSGELSGPGFRGKGQNRECALFDQILNLLVECAAKLIFLCDLCLQSGLVYYMLVTDNVSE